MAEFTYTHEHYFQHVGTFPGGHWECSECGKCIPGRGYVTDGERVARIDSDEGRKMMLDGIKTMFPFRG